MKKRRFTIDVSLRTPHVHYLELIAEQSDCSLSAAFGLILERHAERAASGSKPPKQERKHLTIDPRHALILKRLAVIQGLYEVDVARRIIDEAMAGDIAT